MSEEKALADGAAPKRFLIDAPWFRTLVGKGILGPWVRFVHLTSRRVYDPPDHIAASAALAPAIYLTWHANILAQFSMIAHGRRYVAMTSPHPDGRMAGALVESLGATTIVAAGGRGDERAQGGIAGFRAMARALRDGSSLLLSGEVPPEPGRNIAPGIVAVARLSGRPIIAMGAASTRRVIIERLWDRMQVNLPFGAMYVVAAPPIWVRKETTDAEAAAEIKAALDGVYAEALARADAARTRRRD